MIPLSLAQIAAITGGTVCGDPTLVVAGPAYLDSRSPHREGMFVAIAGERVDGHSFAAHAHAVLGSCPTRRPTIVVPDPVLALGRRDGLGLDQWLSAAARDRPSTSSPLTSRPTSRPFAATARSCDRRSAI